TTQPSPVYVDHAVRRGGAPVRVSGRILDFSTGTGVSGATVVFVGTTPPGALPTHASAVADAAGVYRLTVPDVGPYYPQVDGNAVGQLRVTTVDDRGDLFVHPGTCVRRYGTVLDSRTLRGVAGAKVTLGGRDVLTAADGWYQIDLGCPTNGMFGFNTTFYDVTHPAYADHSEIAGKGIIGVARRDLWLGPLRPPR